MCFAITRVCTTSCQSKMTVVQILQSAPVIATLQTVSSIWNSNHGGVTWAYYWSITRMLPGQRSCAQEPVWSEDQYFLNLTGLWHRTPCVCNTVTNLHPCYIDCAAFCDIHNWYKNQPECNGFWSRQELRIWLNICSCGLTMMLGPDPSKQGQRRRRRNSISAIPDTSQDITIIHLLNSPYEGLYELLQGACFCSDWTCSMKQTITCSAIGCEFSRCQHHTSIEVWTNMQIVLVNTGLWCHNCLHWTSNATPGGSLYKLTSKPLNHAQNTYNDLQCFWSWEHQADCQRHAQ